MVAASKNSTIVRSRRTVRLVRATVQAAYVVSDELGSSLAERLFTTPRRHARPDRERAVIARGRPFEVDTLLRAPRWDGRRVRLAAWRWGFGPTVLLVHGWEGRGSQLGAFVEPLVAAGLSVVAFDAPGHGDSPGSRLYLGDHADAIESVATAIGPVHAVIAHSFGVAATLLAGSRGVLARARLVAIAPNVLIPESVARFSRMVGLDDDARAAFERRLAAATGITLDQLTLDRLVGDGPLLVVHDRDDREVGFAQGERLATTWSGASLAPTTGLGHRRVLRDPDVLARAAAFAGAAILPPASDLVRQLDTQLAEITKRA
jgi:pimeloyl-ACP methyl ester carboxylesterase